MPLGPANAFLADPVFEASFGWRLRRSPGGLAATLLHPAVVKALGTPPKVFAEEYTFAAHQQPYHHRLEAWKPLLAATPAGSVIVTSGTGSGKTGCFLVPILHDLATELDTRRGGSQVSGHSSLPLNALIKSQRDRLTAWAEPFGGRIRYCLYNGETPAEGKCRGPAKCSTAGHCGPIPHRSWSPTPRCWNICWCGPKMPLSSAQSQGTLRWIVIDEAHHYIGSQAAELTLLLRRVLHAFGCHAEEVHFVATSATIADAGDRTRRNGSAPSWPTLPGVSRAGLRHLGQRQVPPLPEALPHDTRLPRSRSPQRAVAPGALYGAGCRPPRPSMALRINPAGPPPLGTGAHGLAAEVSEQSRQATLHLLDLCTQAVNDHDEPLLPSAWPHFPPRPQWALGLCERGLSRTPADLPRCP